MIRKALAIALCLTGAYALLVHSLGFVPRRGITRHQDNFVRLEYALNVKRKCETVLTGSSLTAQMDTRWLGPSITSIAVRAGGARTGLKMCELLETPPKRVVIELNYFQRPEEAETVEYFAGTPLSRLRRMVPPAWQYNHPLNLLLSLQQWRKAQRQKEGEPEAELAVSPAAFDFALNLRLEKGKNPPGQQEVEECCAALGAAIEKLRAQGTEAVLCWMPIDPRVMAAPNFRLWREAYRSKFPPGQYRWIELPDSLGTQTIDGEHLTRAAAREAARLLAAQFN